MRRADGASYEVNKSFRAFFSATESAALQQRRYALGMAKKLKGEEEAKIEPAVKETIVREKKRIHKDSVKESWKVPKVKNSQKISHSKLVGEGRDIGLSLLSPQFAAKL